MHFGLAISIPLCRLSTMEREPRISLQTLKVLGVLTASPQSEFSGAEIGRLTHLPSGSLYPILLRLERAGWLQSRWEDADPRELGRPRRRLYLLTALGESRAKSAIRQNAFVFRGFAWN